MYLGEIRLGFKKSIEASRNLGGDKFASLCQKPQKSEWSASKLSFDRNLSSIESKSIVELESG